MGVDASMLKKEMFPSHPKEGEWLDDSDEDEFVLRSEGSSRFGKGSTKKRAERKPETRNKGANATVFTKMKTTTPPSSKSEAVAPMDSVGVEVGDRVVIPGGGSGVVAYKGEVHYTNGVFLGLVMDGSDGKNSGVIKGTKYFDCPRGKGLMVKLQEVRKI